METLKYFTAKGNNLENKVKGKASHQTQITLMLLQRDFSHAVTFIMADFLLVVLGFLSTGNTRH